MKKVKVNVRKLTGLGLDWAVAMCQGWTPLEHTNLAQTWVQRRDARGTMDNVPVSSLRYSTRWSDGGPIIEEFGIDLRQAKHAEFSVYTYYRPEHFPDAEVIMVAKPWGPDRALKVRNKPHPMDGKWMAKKSQGTGTNVVWSKDDFVSDTPLLAAIRCYVAYNMGAEIEIPEELYGK